MMWSPPLNEDFQPAIDPQQKCVDIIVPVFKNIALTSRCIESLASHLREIAHCSPRMILVNDSPGEPDVRELLNEFSARHPNVVVLESDRNRGFVASANQGLRMALESGRDAILVNSDTQTFDGTLGNLIEAAYSDAQIGFASPRTNNAALCSLPHFAHTLAVSPEVAYQQWKAVSRTLPRLHFAPTAVGYYLFIKYGVLANFGLLDPVFGLGYEEENDLIFRANKVGYRAVLVNNAFAYHFGSASFALLDLNLTLHRDVNLRKNIERNPEFIPLIRRYESSPHLRAEMLLGHLLPVSDDRLKIVFEVSFIRPHYNGTIEMSLAVIRHFYVRFGGKYQISVICPEDGYRFHGLDEFTDIRRLDPGEPICERFAVGIMLAQPFALHQINMLEELAPVCVFGMLDTIAEDCGYLAITHQLEALWGYVARNANGMFFSSRNSEQAFLARHAVSGNIRRYARLLPTKLAIHRRSSPAASGGNILILGNHFRHKAAESTAGLLRGVFPGVELAVLCGYDGETGDSRFYRAGTIDPRKLDSLYEGARIVVLPSYCEGYGRGLLHALSHGRTVVARDIPATREILATYRNISGVFLYENDLELVSTVRKAMNSAGSAVDDSLAESWADWVDGFEKFCRNLLQADDLYERMVNRIREGDLLRSAESLQRLQSTLSEQGIPAAPAAPDPPAGISKAYKDSLGRCWVPAKSVAELLCLADEEFVHAAYVTILDRLPDEDGLANYMSELRSGIGKRRVLVRLRSSKEGRQVGRPIKGYGLIRLQSMLQGQF